MVSELVDEEVPPVAVDSVAALVDSVVREARAEAHRVVAAAAVVAAAVEAVVVAAANLTPQDTYPPKIQTSKK